MKSTSPGMGRRSARARAEAAAWIARLHGPGRTRETEEGLRRWLAEDPEHAAAFERLTDLWEAAAHLNRPRLGPSSTVGRSTARLGFARAAIAASVLALVVTGSRQRPHTDVISTGVGQLSRVALTDGTIIRVDADTRLLVRYGSRSRHVVLERGQAYFDVKHDSNWPFVVTAAGYRIRDVGTRFDVRSEGGVMSVTLIKGAVTVSSVAAHAAAAANESRALSMVPGERLRFAGTGPPRVDWPSMRWVTAWERREVPLLDTSLAVAAAELNRYSRQRIVLADPAIGAIRVSGVVRAGDSAGFAEAVATANRLRVLHPLPDIILLTSAAEVSPAPACLYQGQGGCPQP